MLACTIDMSKLEIFLKILKKKIGMSNWADSELRDELIGEACIAITLRSHEDRYFISILMDILFYDFSYENPCSRSDLYYSISI